MNKIETLFVELTQACNLECLHCGYKDSIEHSISYEAVIDAVEKCIPLGLKLVVLTGGEPMLYRELAELLRYCKEKSLKTKLTTNGTRLIHLKPFLKEALLDIVVVSIDASNPKTYIKIRGKDNLSQIWDEYERLSDFHQVFQFSYLIQKSNYTELIPFLNQCADKNVASVSLLVPHFDGDLTHQLKLESYRSTVFLQEEEISLFRECVVPELLEFYKKNTKMFKCSYNNVCAIIEYSTNHLVEVRKNICSLPLKTAFMYADGTFRLCPYHKEWGYKSIYELLSSLQKARMNVIFEGSKKTSLCRHCLEVPIE